MNREQEILEQLTKLTDEFNMLSCDNSGKACGKCQKKKICDAITELGDAIMEFKFK